MNELPRIPPGGFFPPPQGPARGQAPFPRPSFPNPNEVQQQLEDQEDLLEEGDEEPRQEKIKRWAKRAGAGALVAALAYGLHATVGLGMAATVGLGGAGLVLVGIGAYKLAQLMMTEEGREKVVEALPWVGMVTGIVLMPAGAVVAAVFAAPILGMGVMAGGGLLLAFLSALYLHYDIDDDDEWSGRKSAEKKDKGPMATTDPHQLPSPATEQQKGPQAATASDLLGTQKSSAWAHTGVNSPPPSSWAHTGAPRPKKLYELPPGHLRQQKRSLSNLDDKTLKRRGSDEYSRDVLMNSLEHASRQRREHEAQVKRQREEKERRVKEVYERERQAVDRPDLDADDDPLRYWGPDTSPLVEEIYERSGVSQLSGSLIEEAGKIGRALGPF